MVSLKENFQIHCVFVHTDSLFAHDPQSTLWAAHRASKTARFSSKPPSPVPKLSSTTKLQTRPVGLTLLTHERQSLKSWVTYERMSKSIPIAELGLACPSGGNFYICQGNSTQFIGCCTTDPCAGGAGSCPQANLESATFNKLDYQGIAAQSCINTKAAWYLCSTLSTPFMGCCSSNACTNTAGCPQSDLVAAMLGNSTQARVFLTTKASVASTSRTATSSTSAPSMTSAAPTTTTAATTATTALPATGTAVSESPQTGLSTGAKAGIGIGAVALIALAGMLLLFFKRVLAKRRGVVVRGSEPPSPSGMSYTPASGYAGRSQSHVHTDQSPFASWAQGIDVHLQDPSQITHNTLLSGGSHEPLRPSLAAKSPSTTHARAYSAGSLPSTGCISRETSGRSAASNNVLGFTPGSPGEALRPQYSQYGSQYGYTSPPLDTLAELDGASALPSPASSEMARPTPTTVRPPMSFRPYRPSR